MYGVPGREQCAPELVDHLDRKRGLERYLEKHDHERCQMQHHRPEHQCGARDAREEMRDGGHQQTSHHVSQSYSKRGYFEVNLEADWHQLELTP